MFARLANAMEAPELAADDRYGKIEKRVAERPEVNRIVSAWTSSLPQETLLALLSGGEVPSGPIYDIADIFNEPQYKARNDLVEMGDERIDSITMPGVFPLLSRTPGEIKHLGRALGADNTDVYGDLLGLDADALEALRDDGVI